MLKRVFESALEKIGRLLASQFGLRVVYKGSVPCTDGKTIYLPANPSSLSQDIVEDLNGFLDHEVGHCRYTDFNELKLVGNGPGSRFHLEMINATEDSRVEKKMIKAFPGCFGNLKKINDKYRGKLDEKWNELTLPVRVTVAIADTMNGWKTPADADVEAVMAQIKGETARLNGCKSTMEIRILTGEIIAKLKSIFAPPPPPPEAKPEEGDGEESEDEGKGKAGEKGGKGTSSDDEGEDEGEADGDGSDDESGDSDGSEDDEDSDDEEGSGKGKGDEGEASEDDEKGSSGDGSDDEGEDSEDDGDDDSEGSGESSDGKGEGDGVGTPKEGDKSDGDDEGEENEAGEGADCDGKPSGSTAKSPELSDADRRAMEAERGEECPEWDKAPISLEDALNQEINGEDAKPIEMGEVPADTESFRADRHIPFSTEFDEEVDHTGTGDKTRYDAARKSVAGLIGPIKATLERELKVIENARWRGEQERGVIDSRSLARLATDRSYRKPFKVECKTDTTNVAIEILIDQSGSMGGSKIKLAKATAIALAEALKELGFAFEVTGFHSERDERLGRMAIPSGYNRCRQRLCTPIFKSFDRNELDGIEKLYVGSENPDGEAVRWAANRLSMRKETRKVLIVLSDGEPATGEGSAALLYKDLKESVKKIKEAGIEVIGIGIESEAVRTFYPEWVVVNDAKDLPAEAMRKLSEILRRGFERR